MSASGKFGQGNAPKNRKLTATQVQDIRILYANGNSQGSLAREFQVSIVTIGRIVRGEVWQHLPPPTPTNREIAASAERLMQAQKESETPGRDKLSQAWDNFVTKPQEIMKGLDNVGTDTGYDDGDE